MEQDTEQPSTASTRAFLVARLKRAASLPRMQNGRRPPMHQEGVSDGERGQNDDKKEEDPKEDDFNDEQTHQPESSTEPAIVKDEKIEAQECIQSTEDKSELPPSETGTRTVTPELTTSVVRKRRSRSRSRSRGSRDLRGKARGTPTPTLTSPAPGGDSSADESAQPLPSPQILPLLSPIPSHVAQLQASRLLLSPASDPSLYYPGTSPPTPMLPTLEALQKGLFRSNSASARMMALHKLTGGTDVYDHAFPSPSPTPPPPSKLSRNNTVSGGERNVARQLMLKRLAERTTKETDGDITSGDERATAPSPSLHSTSTPVQTIFPIDDPPSEQSLPPSESPAPPTPPGEVMQESNRSSPCAPLPQENSTEHKRRRRRSVVIEEEDPKDEEVPLEALPGTPSRHSSQSRVAHDGSDAPSNDFTDSPGNSAVSAYLSARQGTPSRQEFSSSPFQTPLTEKPSHDEEEEKVLYHAESRFLDAFNHPISWVAEPVPERMPLDEDDEEVDAERAASSTPFKGYAPQDEDPASCYSTSKLVIESEVSSDVVPSQVPPSPSSAVALSNTASMIRTSDESSSPQLFPTRLSVASRIQSERSPLGAEFGFVEVDEPRAGGTTELSSKRSGESGSTSTWEKVKNTLTGGRRSRTNSILTRDKREHTESGVSRESGASIVSAKTDKGDAGGAAAAAAASAVQQCHTPVMMQAPSASASILSLPPYATPVPRSGVSPVPPATSVLDLLKYQDAKLFPFPGMKKLEEQRNRARALTSPSSASSPDIVLSPQGMDVDPPANASSSSSTTPLRTPEVGRGRKLSHQASDTRLLARYNVSGGAAAATADNLHNFTQFPTPAPSPPSGVQSALSKLPTNREGVRKWLNAKKLFSSQSASNSAPQQPAVAPNAGKKPSLSDLLKGRKDDLNSDWDETGSDKSRTPTSVSATALLAKTSSASDVTPLPNGATTAAATTPIEQSPQHSREQTESENTPKGEMALPTLELKASSASQEPYPDYETRLSLASPLEPPAPSITPDPMSSAGYSGRSTSESSSTTSSHYSTRHSAQGAVVLERLDEMFGPGSRSPMWASAIDDPPRKLLLSSPVLQVVNSITVKDRFLFLFSDILVIAKPIMHEQEHLLDNSKPNPLDRKYVVQNVVLLRHLRFNADREEAHVKPAFHANGSRNPLVRTFVHQFGKDPDLAIANLFDKTGCRDDPTVLGQFLFRTLDIDRARLGDYLSRRTSKLVLKAYIDSFCFTGLRVDKSLRTFLHSIHIPSRMVGSLEYLLDAFAVRWYEANAGVVAYDKDVAVRLVRAIVQLNDVMHGNISSEPGPTGYPRRNVTSREFLEAFRRYDARGLVSDDLLDNLYNSIRRERLSQARIPTSNGPVDIHIAIKRPLPPRVTYRMQSEPIVLRIPQPDPQFTILLYGQDLVFEPPTLTFSKSSEASFRVTGTSLGPKTMIMHRSGPNALAYSGLPLNGSVIVERAFMRNTFQIAFENQHRIKRRYMFSVDDPLIRHQWTVSLKRQIDAAGSTGTGSLSGSRGSDFHRAADSIAFKVLQEVLLGADRSSVIRPTSNLEKGIHRVSTPSLRGPNGSLSHHAPYPPYNGRPDGSLLRAAVGRSKSRSKVYHRHGPGKLEQELNLSGDESRDSRDLGDEDVFGSGTYDVPSPRINGRLWSGRDLQMQCQQNSSVALVLAYLQVGAPDLDHGDS